MPPKNNKKKDNKKKELSADDMRRLGMTEEDIARIMAERGKSSEEKQAEQAREEAQRREAEAKARAHKELVKDIEALVKDEAEPRVQILQEEESEWVSLAGPLTVEKNRLVRAFLEKEAQRKTAEARKRREAELQAWKASLESMSEEERQKLIEEQEEKERQRQAEIVAQEEALRAKEERREARRKERAERMRKGGMGEMEAYLMAQVSSEDDEATTDKTKAKQKAKQRELDDMDFAMRERYER